MKVKFIFGLLLGTIFFSSCQSDTTTTDGSLLESPFEVFEYVTSAGRTYTPEINNEKRKISIYDIEYSENIVEINYQLKEGLTIFPTPESRLSTLRETEVFVISDGVSKIAYEMTLVDFYKEFVAADAMIYAQQPYACEIKYHLYDLKNDTSSNNLDTYSNAEIYYQDFNMCGVRLPIWGSTDTVTGEEGHPEAGVVNLNVYERTYSRVKNALNAFLANGNSINDFIVFISIKSSGSTECKLPDWCFVNGVNARANLIPENYAILIEDYVRALKANVNSNLQIHVIGLDNESALANASATSTTWMHYETVPLVKERFAANGWNTPRFISHEAWEPKNFGGSYTWYKALLTTNPETVDIYGVHYYHDKDHPKYFYRLEDEWDGSMTDPLYAHPDGVEREYWASEPHWYATGASDVAASYYGDFLKVSEQAMCCLWAQSDLGMTAFAWWSLPTCTDTTTAVRNVLMRLASVPITGATPIRFVDHDDEGFSKNDTTTDDVTRYYDLDSNNLKTRAFIRGNTVVLYLLNIDWYFNYEAGTAPEYKSYKIGLADAVLKSNTINYEMVMGNETEMGITRLVNQTQSVTVGENYFEFDIPARSFTCLEFEVTFTTTEEE